MFKLLFTILMLSQGIAQAVSIKASASQSTYEFWKGRKCSQAKLDETRILKNFCSTCLQELSPAAPTPQVTQLDSILESSFFSLAAQKQVDILKCNIQKIELLTGDSGSAQEFRNAIAKDVGSKLEILRSLKGEMAKAKERIDFQHSAVNWKVSSGDYKSYEEALKKFEINGALYDAIYKSLWSSSHPEMQKYLNSVIDSSIAPQDYVQEAQKGTPTGVFNFFRRNVSLQDQALRKIIEYEKSDLAKIEKTRDKRSFVVAEYNLNQSTKELIVKRGDAFAQLITENKIPAEDVEGFACRLDARYGNGPEYLNNSLLIGSFALGGTGFLMKASALRKITPAITATSNSMVVGVDIGNALKLGLADLLLTTSAAAGTAFTLDQVLKNCGSAPEALRQNQCNDHNLANLELKKMEHENCVLYAGLAVLPLTHISKLVPDIFKLIPPLKRTFENGVTKIFGPARAAHLEALTPGIIKEGVNFSTAEIAHLQNRAKEILSINPDMGAQIKQIANLYFEARMRKLPNNLQEIVKAKLSKPIPTNQGVGFASSTTGEVFINMYLNPTTISYYQVLAHEIEHVTQFLKNKTIRDIFLKSPGRTRYEQEVGAIGTQYDIIKTFPRELIEKDLAILKQQGPFSLPRHHVMLENMLEGVLRAKDRESYILAMRQSQGYTPINIFKINDVEVISQKQSLILKTLVIYQAFRYIVDLEVNAASK